MRQEPDHAPGQANPQAPASELPGQLNAELEYTVEIGLCTHRGTNPSRPLNEDSVLGYLPLGRAPDGVCAVAALADGMGGGHLGERASAEAVESVSRALCGGNYREWAAHCSLPASAFDHTTKELAKQIHSLLLAESSDLGVQGSMCATLDILLLTPDRYYIAHAGDSVVWQVNGNTVLKLTEDHSEETYARLHGLPLPREDGAVTNILGQPAGIRVDPLSGVLTPGTTFILTSDGVHRKLQRKALTYCLEGRNAQQAAEQLVGVAVRMDGTDNASAVVVRLLPRGTKSSGIAPGQAVLLPANIEHRRTNDCVVPNGLSGSPARASSAPGGSARVGGAAPQVAASAAPATDKAAPVEHGPPPVSAPRSSMQTFLLVGLAGNVLVSIGLLIAFVLILWKERPVTREEFGSAEQQISEQSEGLAAIHAQIRHFHPEPASDASADKQTDPTELPQGDPPQAEEEEGT